MALYEIDHDATQRRLDAITSNGLRALGDCTRRSAEIDERVAEMLAHQEREKQAMDERIKQATEERTSHAEPARPVTKPATLALGGEEFQEARRGRFGAAKPGQGPGGPEAVPGSRAAPVSWFGGGGDRGDGDVPGTGREDAKVKRRPSRPGSPEGDDDLSGRTWLR